MGGVDAIKRQEEGRGRCTKKEGRRENGRE